MTAAGAARGRRLRLAFVLWSGAIGGAETFVAELARVLREADVDASIVTVEGADPLARRLRETGVPYTELRLERGRAALRHPRRLAGAVGRAGPDGAVLVAGGFLALALRLGGYRAQTVAVEHGSVLQTGRLRRRPRLLDRLDALLGKPAVDVHVAVSSFLRTRMSTAPARTVTIPNGVDLDRFRPRPAPVPADGFVIGCMSRLVPGKGIEDVVVAARPAIRKGATLHIAGDGPSRAALEQLAEELGIREAVTFEGWIPDAATAAAFWNACTVAVAAPNELVESFGLVAVEAMACGRPVVATRAGALADTVVDGKTGLLVAPGDTAALARALLRYAGDPALVAAHGRGARAWCEQEFDIRRSARAYAALFGTEPAAAAADRRRKAALDSAVHG